MNATPAKAGTHGSANQPIECLLRLTGSPCEPVFRCLLGILDSQVSGQGGEDRCWVVCPARHSNIDLGCAAVTVPGEEFAQPDLWQIAAMESLRLFRELTPVQRKTFLACFLGWALSFSAG